MDANKNYIKDMLVFKINYQDNSGYMINILENKKITEYETKYEFVKGAITLANKSIPVIDVKSMFDIYSFIYTNTCLLAIYLNDIPSVCLFVDDIEMVMHDLNLYTLKFIIKDESGRIKKTIKSIMNKSSDNPSETSANDFTMLFTNYSYTHNKKDYILNNGTDLFFDSSNYEDLETFIEIFRQRLMENI